MRGRWYDCVGGIGLEVETGSDDPEYRWRVAGHIEEKGKRRKTFHVMVNPYQERNVCLAVKYSLEDAQDFLARRFGVTKVVTFKE